MWWGRSHYIFRFPCSHRKIFDGMDQEGKFKNTRSKGTDKAKFEKTRRKEPRQEKQEIYWPHATKISGHLFLPHNFGEEGFEFNHFAN
jgi:hypothetical protein